MPVRAPRGLLAAVILALLAATAAPASAQDSPTPPDPVSQQTPAPEAGEETEFVVVRQQVDPDVLRQEEGIPSLEERGYETRRVPDGMTQEEFLEQLRADPEVVSAEPDARVYAAQTPNDPFYINQPGQQQVGYLSSVGVPGAWDHSVGREEVVVAVLDSGTDLSHPDLESQLWTNEGEVPGNGTDDDGNGCIDDVHGCRFVKVDSKNQTACGYLPGDGTPTGDVSDDNEIPGSNRHSHGTMVSGIVGAAGDNNEGIAGVGWNVRLMPVKVLDCGGLTSRNGPGGYLSDVAKGIDYARRMGADVINLSLATSPDVDDNSALRGAIAAAEDEGVIIVAAAGNYGSSPDPSPGYPGRYNQYSNLVTVGASNWQSNHEWEEFSAYGPSLDLAAPGSQLITTIRSDIAPQNPYGIAQRGTSFATPFVSGMFALMISRNSAMEMTDYIDMAREAADPAPAAPHGENWAGDGIINVYGAVRSIPMLVTGRAQEDWVDLPAGTSVDARIEGVSCGSVQTTSVGQVSRFELWIEPAAAKSGCGEPGREFDIFVQGKRSESSVTWGGPTEELVVRGVEATTVSPDPGPVVVQALSPGWNNIAHLEEPGEVPSALDYLPSSWDVTYAWHAGQERYMRMLDGAPAYANTWDEVDTYDAYWVHLTGSANPGSVNPDPEPGRSIVLDEGWNNFVYTGTSRKVDEALADLDGAYDAVYRYDNETGEWVSYFPGRTNIFNTVGGLLKMQVYWVHMTRDGILEMD